MATIGNQHLHRLLNYFGILLAGVFFLVVLEGCDEDSGGDDDPIDIHPVDSTKYYPGCVEAPADTLGQTGCYDMFMVKYLDSIPTQAISITIDTSLIDIGVLCEQFTLPQEGILVELLTKKDAPDSIYFYFCKGINNVLVAEPYSDPLISGMLTIGASSNWDERDSTEYFASAILDSASFKSERIDTIIYNTVFYKVPQGWFPL